MNKIIILPMVLIFCFAMISCEKSASERAMDDARDILSKEKQAVRQYNKHMEQQKEIMDDYKDIQKEIMDDYKDIQKEAAREYNKLRDEYGY